MYNVQRGVERLLRAVIMLSVYAGIFGFRTWTLHSTRKAHITWLRLLGCQARNCCAAHHGPLPSVLEQRNALHTECRLCSAFKGNGTASHFE